MSEHTAEALAVGMPGQFALVVHAAPLIEHAPATTGQLALVVHAVPVWIEQCPATLQLALVVQVAPTLPAEQVLAIAGQSALVAQALPSMLHFRFCAGQSAFTEHEAPVIEHFLTAAQSEVVSQTVVVTIEQLPAFGQVPDAQALPVRSQVPPTFGQLALVWHCALLIEHLPSAGQLPAPVPVHAALLTLHLPLIAAQLALVVHEVPVFTEQLPVAGHCVAALAGWQATLVLLQAPLIAAQLASLVQTVPVLTLQWPALVQLPAPLPTQAAPVRLQLPLMAGQFASLEQPAPLTEQAPDVLQACFWQTVFSVQVPHSGPTQVLQPGGSNCVEHVVLSSGQSALVVHAEPLWAQVFLRLQVCVL
jgi:hypothetical protein